MEDIWRSHDIIYKMAATEIGYTETRDSSNKNQIQIQWRNPPKVKPPVSPSYESCLFFQGQDSSRDPLGRTSITYK